MLINNDNKPTYYLFIEILTSDVTSKPSNDDTKPPVNENVSSCENIGTSSNKDNKPLLPIHADNISSEEDDILGSGYPRDQVKSEDIKQEVKVNDTVPVEFENFYIRIVLISLKFVNK